MTGLHKINDAGRRRALSCSLSDASSVVCIILLALLCFYQLLSVRTLHRELCSPDASMNDAPAPLIISGNETAPKLKRNAVVVTVKAVDECVALRLRHLVESSSHAQRDVWVLHSHYKMDKRYKGGKNEAFARELCPKHGVVVDGEFSIASKDPVFERSQRLIEGIPGLKSAHQCPVRIPPFDDGKAGASKSSALKLIVQQGYRFGWMVEDDVFLTGKWGELFDVLDERNPITNAVDVLSVIHEYQPRIQWWKNDQNRCKLDGKECRSIMPTQTGMMLIRVSGNWASSLLRDLETGSAWGFQESIPGAYSRDRNFTIQPIPRQHIGSVIFGMWGKTDYDLDTHGSIERNKLYHPVKCSEYQDPGSFENILQKWTQ